MSKAELSNRSFQPTKPFVTALAGARPAPNAFAAEADVRFSVVVEVRSVLRSERLIVAARMFGFAVLVSPAVAFGCSCLEVTPQDAFELECLEFFKAEPELLDPGIWVYSESTYRASDGARSVVCQLEPASHAVRIRIDTEGLLVCRLDVSRAQDVRLVRDKHGDHMEVVVSEDSSAELRLSPNISLRMVSE